MISTSLRRSDRIWLFLAILHLGIVVIAGDRFFSSRNFFTSSLRLYGDLTGSRYVYGFFTPRASARVRLKLVLGYSGSRPSETLDVTTLSLNPAVRNRTESIVDRALIYPRKEGPLPVSPRKKAFIQSIADTALIRYPSAETVTVHFEKYDPPQYDGAQHSEDWQEIDQVQVSRKKTGPAS